MATLAPCLIHNITLPLQTILSTVEHALLPRLAQGAVTQRKTTLRSAPTINSTSTDVAQQPTMPSQADIARLGPFTTLLGPDANIDRHGHTRTVPMSVLSLGISRTGTLSMQSAFATLGYASPYHFTSLLINIRDADIWNELLGAKFQDSHHHRTITRAELDQVLGHCGAVTDVPCAVLWRDLVAAYPSAKVVLVERDEDAWANSIQTLLEGMLNPFVVYVLRFTDPGWCGRIFNLGLLWTGGWFGTTNLAQAKKNARAAYRAHNAAIRAAVPKERLLVYELGSGWEPLCEFLGKEVPDVPFPHHNESKVLKVAFETTFARAFRRSAVNVTVVVAVLAVGIGAVMRVMA